MKITVKHQSKTSKGIVKNEPYLEYSFLGAWLKYRKVVRFV